MSADDKNTERIANLLRREVVGSIASGRWVRSGGEAPSRGIDRVSRVLHVVWQIRTLENGLVKRYLYAER